MLHTYCLGIVHVQTVAFRPSHPMRGVNPKAALASYAFPRFVVRWRGPGAAPRMLGYGRRSGHGAFTGFYLPKTNAPCE